MQAKLAGDHRLRAKFYILWSSRLKQAREANQQSLLAMYHWSLVLQQKVSFICKIL